MWTLVIVQSYISQSIWRTRVLIKEGVRWHIGDDSLTNLWQEPWLGEFKWYKLRPFPHTSVNHLLMKDLMVIGEKVQDPFLLNALCSQEMVTNVIQTPLLEEVMEDEFGNSILKVCTLLNLPTIFIWSTLWITSSSLYKETWNQYGV